ncbi:MAG TPA: gliding motility-associated C-terminal domain-containing protein [Aequorivita sp.]|nr:gliding motility-associated C-terminal domain-containing protein [Aequorivita sp.]
MKNILLYISIVLVLSFGTLKAQTSNEGMLYISEGTKFSTLERLDNLATGQLYNDGDTFIYSHFNNDGVLDFYQNTGLTRFIGKTFQTISGTKTSYLYNVYFNNVSNAVPFQLAGQIDISGISNFNEGIVDNDNFGGEITFNTEASHINTSDYSHVDGPVNKFGNKEFTFPIGDGGYYRFGGISAPASSEAIFEGKFYFENSNDMYSHQLKAGVLEEIDNQEYWTIKEQTATNEDVLITLSWRDVTTPQSMIDAAGKDALTIVRWDEATNMWINEGGAIDLEKKTVTTAVKDYGVFTFGRVKPEAVLPGGLTVYTAVTPNGDGINDYFFIDIPNDGSVRDLQVQIFNRWGVKVFESHNYGVGGDVFDGFSSGRLTVKNTKQLPSGTYYYILDYEFGAPGDNNRHKQAGFLYLSGN